MSERLKFMGRRQELETEKKGLEIKIQGLIANIRDAADPLLPVEDLDPESVAVMIADLDRAQKRFRLIVVELKKIHDLIGG